MKNFKKNYLRPIIILGLLLTTTSIIAQPHPRRGRPLVKPQWHDMASDSLELLTRLFKDSLLIRKIKISTKQQQQFRNMYSDHQKQMIKLKAQMRTLEIDLKSEMSQKKPSKYRALRVFKKIQKIWNKEKETEFILLFRINKLLAKKQQNLLRIFMATERQRFRRGFQHRNFHQDDQY